MLEINPAGKKPENAVLRYSGRITIVENISGNSFKVRAESLAGSQEFIVLSKNSFSPGDIVNGKILLRGNSLFLSVSNKPQNNPLFNTQDTNIHTKNDILSRFLASFLDSTGKKADNILVSILQSLISKKKITDNFYATLAGESYLKGLRNESSISAFLDAVSPDQDKNHGEQKQGKKDNKKEEVKEILSDSISDSEQEDSPIFIFNHLPLPDKNWIIIPFKMDDLKGDLRLKTVENELKNLIISVEKDTFKWFFEISDLKKPEKMVKIYANKEGILACRGEKFNLLKKKLHNLGVKIDDNIYDIQIFNGFSKINASYNVDLRI